MKIEYDQEYLKELYESGQCKDKKHRFQPQVIKNYQKRVDTLIAATKKEDLFVFRSLNFEALQGGKQGLYSIRIDIHYRLEFSLKEDGEEAIVTVCLLKDISNHYK